MSENSYNIEIPAMHDKQREILAKAKRFNAVMCGRRFGKTVLITRLFLKMLEGKRIGLFAHIFKDIKETWESLEQMAIRINNAVGTKKPYIQIDGTAKTMHIIKEGQTVDNAACIEFWSIKDEGAKDNGRGRKYHIVIYEETQKIKSDVLEYHWTKVARATLLDFSGDAWFFGTAPNSRSHYFYSLVCRGALNNPDLIKAPDIVVPPDTLRSPDFMTFRMPSSDNPYISKVELEQIATELPDLIFRQEYKAECVEFAQNLWCFTLSNIQTQRKLFKPTSYFPAYAQYIKRGWKMVLKFDFNKNPMAATVSFCDDDLRYIHTRKEFGAPKGEKVLLTYTTGLIKEWIYKTFGIKIGKWDKNYYECPPILNLFVTGDYFGSTRDGRTPRTDYDIIKEDLGLIPAQFRLKTSNPRHIDSHSHVNTYIEKHPNYQIDEIECPNLRTDMLNTRANEDKGIDKKHYDPHFFDTERYFFDNFTPSNISKLDWYL